MRSQENQGEKKDNRKMWRPSKVRHENKEGAGSKILNVTHAHVGRLHFQVVAALQTGQFYPESAAHGRTRLDPLKGASFTAHQSFLSTGGGAEDIR